MNVSKELGVIAHQVKALDLAHQFA